MKILFVRSWKKGGDPISTNQGESIKKMSIELEYFDIFGNGILGYLRNIPRLRKTVKTYKPDIIHAHYYLSGFLSSLSFTGKPIVTSLMGTDITESDIIKQSIIRFFVLYLWKATIIKSANLYKQLKISSAYIIPNGVDMDKFIPISIDIAKEKLNWFGKKNILFASDPERFEKNYELARQALNILQNQGYELEIYFLNGIRNEEIYLYYSAADVLLLTSLYEGSPNVVKEAMACNCPIVATDVGDIREVIRDTTGCYLTSFDPYDVSAKIKLVLESNKRTNGRDNLKHLDSRVIVKKIIEVYESVLNKSK